jgi:hypothetical protein
VQRRRVIVLGTLASGVALAGATTRVWRPHAAGLARRIRPAPVLDAAAVPGPLSTDDLETMVAFGLVLLPSSGADPEWVRGHVRARAEQVPGVRAEYVRCVQALDAVATAPAVPFRDRLRVDQVAAVAAVLPNYAGQPRWRRAAARLLAAPTEVAIRQLVAGDLMAAHYRTRAGWAAVGYAHFPGVAATDPLGYATPPQPPA